jgi:hypothetical protein
MRQSPLAIFAIFDKMIYIWLHIHRDKELRSYAALIP